MTKPHFGHHIDRAPLVVKRIAVVGPSGAGKTAISLELGRILSLPVIHLDQLYWRPGWVGTPRTEWVEIHRGLLPNERWILDGNYGGTLKERLERADTAIFLDLPRRVCILGVFRRFLTYFGRTRPDLGPFCPEKVPDLEFLRWIWDFPKAHRPLVRELLDAFARRGGRVSVLRSRLEIRDFIREKRGGRPEGRPPMSCAWSTDQGSVNHPV